MSNILYNEIMKLEHLIDKKIDLDKIEPLRELIEYYYEFGDCKKAFDYSKELDEIAWGNSTLSVEDQVMIRLRLIGLTYDYDLRSNWKTIMELIQSIEKLSNELSLPNFLIDRAQLYLLEFSLYRRDFRLFNETKLLLEAKENLNKENKAYFHYILSIDASFSDIDKAFININEAISYSSLHSLSWFQYNIEFARLLAENDRKGAIEKLNHLIQVLNEYSKENERIYFSKDEVLIEIFFALSYYEESFKGKYDALEKAILLSRKTNSKEIYIESLVRRVLLIRNNNRESKYNFKKMFSQVYELCDIFDYEDLVEDLDGIR
ncbi:TPA: hypothetical protein ACGO9G_001350 [Streptococcus suis]